MNTINTKELDLRNEFDDLLRGKDFGNEKFVPWIFTKTRTDGHGNMIKCTCWINESHEGIKGCGSCGGKGYLWDEFIIPGFIFPLSNNMLQLSNKAMSSGKIDDESLAFVTYYNNDIQKSDIISQPQLTTEGAFVVPIKKIQSFTVNFTRELRLDFGKTEFMEVIMKAI